MAVTFDGHESHIPRKHGIRNFFLTLAGVTTLGAGGAVLENRVGVIDPAQRFLQDLLQKERGSAAAQTVAEPTVEPVRLVSSAPVREQEASRAQLPSMNEAAMALDERGQVVNAQPGYRFVLGPDGVVRECNDGNTICIRKNGYRLS